MTFINYTHEESTHYWKPVVIIIKILLAKKKMHNNYTYSRMGESVQV